MQYLVVHLLFKLTLEVRVMDGPQLLVHRHLNVPTQQFGADPPQPIKGRDGFFRYPYP